MDNESMDALFSTLTGHDEEVAPKTKNPASASSKSAKKKAKNDKVEATEERLCTIVDKEQNRKLRIIAKREGVQIKDVIRAAFKKAIDSYERKHGKIEDDGKKNLNEIF